MASDTIFEMKHISDDARVAVVIFRKDNEEIEDTFLSASPEEFERVVHLIMLLRDFMRVSPYWRRTVRSLLQPLWPMCKKSETDRHLTGRNARHAPANSLRSSSDWCTNTVRASATFPSMPRNSTCRRTICRPSSRRPAGRA